LPAGMQEGRQAGQDEKSPNTRQATILPPSVSERLPTPGSESHHHLNPTVTQPNSLAMEMGHDLKGLPYSLFIIPYVSS